MTDKAVSSLPDGGAVEASDIGYVVRAGNSRKVALGDSLAEKVSLAIDKASDAEVRSAAFNKVLTADLIESASAIVGLTETGGSIAVDWDAFIFGSVMIDENSVLANPTNGQPGTERTIFVFGNDGTDRTLTFGNQYLGPLPTLTDIDSAQSYLLTIFCVSATHFVVSSRESS